jgi:predicted  nucleic acid-binding Zn-ribbon protein
MRKVFFLFLALSLSGVSWAQSAPGFPVTPISTTYADELTRLKVIFARLQAISMQLDVKLSTSEEALRKLSLELATLRDELAGLRLSLGESLTESEALAEMLEKSAISLARVSESFEDYSREAEAKIKALDRKAKGWKTAGIVGIGIGAGLGLWGLTR